MTNRLYQFHLSNYNERYSQAENIPTFYSVGSRFINVKVNTSIIIIIIITVIIIAMWLLFCPTLSKLISK
jgi:hypothetical protein